MPPFERKYYNNNSGLHLYKNPHQAHAPKESNDSRDFFLSPIPQLDYTQDT